MGNNDLILELKQSTKILVETPDEFLAQFPPQYFENTTLINQFKTFIAKEKPIGQPSAIGNVYNFMNQYILKVSHYCEPSNIGPKNQLCRIAMEGDLIFRIPNTHTGKMMIYAPNYFLEGLIGILVYNETLKYTPSFMKVYSIQYDPTVSDPNKPSKTTYMVTEKLEEISNYITDYYTFLDFQFQILFALDVAQKTGRYVHYDLHAGNVMARPKAADTVNIYTLDNGLYFYSLRDFEAVIIDYGFNRYETKSSVLSPRWNFNNTCRECLDYYFFNPYYDVFTLLFTNIQKLIYGGFAWKVPDSTYFQHKLFSLFFNLPENTPLKDVYDVINSVLVSDWRPVPEILAYQDDFRSSTPYEMYNKIINIFRDDMNNINPPKPNDVKGVTEFLKKNKIYITDQVIDFKKFGLKSKHYSTVPTKKRMNTTYYNYAIGKDTTFGPMTIKNEQISNISGVRNYTIPENHTLPQSIENSPIYIHEGNQVQKFGDQYIHMALIDQEVGKNMGYNFRFDCCRIDLRNYFQTKDIKSGIAINAAFFNLLDNFLPIGYYKTEDFYLNNQPPNEYKSYYAIVAISDTGTLVIDDTLDNKGYYNNVITAGPLLVFNGQQKITIDIIRQQTFGNYLFQCRRPQQKSEEDQKTFNDGVRNCTKVQPGEFSHASNPNPRTALCITNDNKVLFIYVEGRDNRGSGMDLIQLAELCLAYGAKHAINLDGGGSSQFIWKKPGEQLINIANPNQSMSYPVGSIISYIK